MALEVIAIALNEKEAGFIRRLLATGGVVSSLNYSPQRGKWYPGKGDLDLNEGHFEILVDLRALAAGKQILSEYHERLAEIHWEGADWSDDGT